MEIPITTKVIKQINKELAGTGFQIKINKSTCYPKGTEEAEFVHIENEEGEFLFSCPTVVKALLQIGAKSGSPLLSHDDHRISALRAMP